MKPRWKKNGFLLTCDWMEMALSGLVDAGFHVSRDFVEFEGSPDSLQKVTDYTDEEQKERLRLWETREPERERTASHMLLLWSLCCNNLPMAKIFWPRAGDSVANALLSCNMLRNFAKVSTLQRPALDAARLDMGKNADCFEQLAIDLVVICQSSDNQKTKRLLLSKNAHFSKLPMNCLEICLKGKLSAFISQRTTQSLIQNLWFRLLRPGTPWYKILFGWTVVPLFFIQLTDRADLTLDESEDDMLNMRLLGIGNFETGDELLFHKSNGFIQSFKNIIFAMVTAPFSKYIAHAVYYMILLLMYSYLLLSPTSSVVSSLEWTVLLCFGGITLEEVQEALFFYAATSFHNIGASWTQYWRSGWNFMDLTALSLYWASTFIRFRAIYQPEGLQSDQLAQAKTLAALTNIVLWANFARFYRNISFIGPKLIMMWRMGQDIIVFILLAALLLIGYGITAEVLLHPDTQPDRAKLAAVLYRPYFQIYGEMFLDEMDAETQCFGPHPFFGCDENNEWLLPFIMGVYLLALSIGLVNLLIAMFNDTYASIQVQARELWNLQTLGRTHLSF